MKRILTIIAILAAPRTALSQSDVAAAEVLYDEAMAARGKKDLATACPKFAESYRLDPKAPTLVMVADCEANDAKIADAWGHLQEALGNLRDAAQIAYARKLSSALEKRVPRLLVKLAPGASNVTVKRDGIELRSATLGTALPVNPGEHTIMVNAPGRKEATFKTTAVEGKTVEIEVSPGEPDEASPAPKMVPPADASKATSAANDDAGSDRKTPAYVLLGVGGAGLGVGAVFALLSLSKFNAAKNVCQGTESACSHISERDLNNSAGSSDKTVATVGMVVGGLATVAGASWLVFSSSTGATTTATPFVGAHVAGASLGGAW